MSSVPAGPEILPTSFDRLTALACAALDLPFGLVSVLEDDQAVFRSEIGTGQKALPREVSVSARLAAMGPDATLVVTDALEHPEFCRHPWVTGEPGIRFFVGTTICDAAGSPIGAIAAMDTVLHDPPTPSQMTMLRHLARLAGDLYDQVQVQRKQFEQMTLLGLAEEMAGLGRWRFDLVTRKVDWSDAVYRIHGRDPETFDPSYADVLSDYHPEDRENLAAHVERAITTGEGYDLELRLVSATRGERRVITRAGTEIGEHGRPIALFGVFQDITDIVRTQERLERSETLFREMSDTATDIIARYALDGTFLYLSPAVETILGYRPDEMVGRTCEDFIPAEDLAGMKAVIQAYVEAGPGATPPRHEYRGIRADGTMVWLEATPRAVWDETGCKVLEIHDHVRDITTRKAAERVQLELVETLGMAEELGGVGCWRLDVASGAVTWSDEVYRIHGKSRATFDPSFDDAVGCYHPDDRPVVAEVCQRAIETGESGGFQLRLIREDGEERIVTSQCRPERDETGAITALYGVFQDVTEQVRAEEIIRASEARYRLLADNSTDIIATFGLDGVFRYVSPAVQAAMGYEADAVIGRPISDFIHPEDYPRVLETFAAYAKAPEGTPSPRVAYRAIHRDGRTVWLEAHPRLIRDDHGQPVEFQDVVRDITETKALEDELIAAKEAAEHASKAKTEFLANMSHELRTPLTSVIGFSGLLKDSPALPEAERRYADRIATASEALLGVINDILDYSKLEAEAFDLDPQPFDPAETARSAAAIVEGQCAAKRLALTLDLDTTLPIALMGDEGRIRQVLLNFLSNAVKFTVSGEIRLETRWSEGRLRVAVSDSGIGVAPEKIETLFDRFTQADASTTRVYGGTGLGLAISRRLIEMMGGEIGATSRPGEGSTFWFEVPLPVAEAGDADEPDAVFDLPTGLKVLMADDAPANRELVRIILAGWDVELETVENGAEAVQAAAKGAYDLILMDVHMPVMDGMDATRAIRALPGSIGRVPVIALTANVQPEQVEACCAAGMDAHVGKPIQVGELIATMAQALSRTMDENAGDRAA
ncbi:PAS domain S-box protein [Brevundimonas bacteroides]|uniref:PAS domain S-box protein n=1 Tax=Brevundimonas bacteroides TaxID=74311 RepID=UPI00069011EA|nr:PAS domain S-box protein [Brevundimonas bacteroides]